MIEDTSAGNKKRTKNKANRFGALTGGSGAMSKGLGQNLSKKGLNGGIAGEEIDYTTRVRAS